MKYIRNFNSQDEYEKYRRLPSSILGNSVSLAGTAINYYDKLYPFYVEAIEDIGISTNNGKYSYDGKTWVEFTNISIKTGERVYITKGIYSDSPYIKVTGGTYNVGGGFNLAGDCFAGEEGLISAENLILNVSYYYGSKKKNETTQGLFEGCINLKKAPKVISNYSKDSSGGGDFLFTQAFKGCTSLEEVPTILVDLPYNAHSSYNLSQSFYGCSNLKKVEILCTKLYSQTYINVNNWLSGVSETGLITLNYKASSTFLSTILPTIPEGWEVRYLDIDADKYYIKFTIDGVEHLAEYGMTWQTWVSSKYNTIGLTQSSSQNDVCCDFGYIMFNGVRVKATETICAKRVNYTFKSSVYIQHIDGTLYTSNEWVTGGFDDSVANGVAVVDEVNNRGVVVAKSKIEDVIWGPNDVSISTSSDFGSGESNTNMIINTLGDNGTYAAKSAKAYTFPNGNSGFLPSYGEASIIFKNLSLTNIVLKKINGSTISDITWTSTQNSIDRAYFMWPSENSMSYFGNVKKSWDKYVRPIILLDLEEAETTSI